MDTATPTSIFPGNPAITALATATRVIVCQMAVASSSPSCENTSLIGSKMKSRRLTFLRSSVSLSRFLSSHFAASSVPSRQAESLSARRRLAFYREFFMGSAGRGSRGASQHRIAYRPSGGGRTGLRGRRRFLSCPERISCPGRHPPKGGTHVKRNFYPRLISAPIIAPDSTLGSLKILFETSTRELILSDVAGPETILGMNRSGKEREN